MNLLERFFHIRARDSSLGRELLGGVTAFFTTAYLLAAVPGLLCQTGMDASVAITAVCLSAALIVVGMMMMSGIAQIHWVHVEVSLPCFLIIVGMPFTGSITDGIALGCISYVIIMVCRKRWAIISQWMYALAGLFVLMYLLVAL